MDCYGTIEFSPRVVSSMSVLGVKSNPLKRSVFKTSCFLLAVVAFFGGGGVRDSMDHVRGDFFWIDVLKRGRNDEIIHNCDIFLFTGGEKNPHVGVYKLQGKQTLFLKRKNAFRPAFIQGGVTRSTRGLLPGVFANARR